MLPNGTDWDVNFSDTNEEESEYLGSGEFLLPLVPSCPPSFIADLDISTIDPFSDSFSYSFSF